MTQHLGKGKLEHYLKCQNCQKRLGLFLAGNSASYAIRKANELSKAKN
jgi:hypothetical protein